MRIIIITMLIACVPVLTGCNTVAGLGKDLQAGGQGIQRAAQPTK